MKNIKNINEPHETKPREISINSMKADYNFSVAEAINKKLLSEGLITLDESLRLSKLNKKTFNPLYVEILD